ncbi:MAG: alpha/beta hydrolase [Candidatus Bathyarchaeota archaeon]|nr:alpha/beta hydrolase [Candidatus Bathyarchaeota archaeon]
MTGYWRYIKQQYQRIQDKTKILATPYGNIEYSEGGIGPDVLISHGSGGGFDQGELIAQTILSPQFHWITPSRFGYLQSTFQPGSTFDDQAHAYAALLDHLGIEKVAVVALSHGGPSALLFAVLYPERVSSLTLISAGVTSIASENQKQAHRQGTALTYIYKHDWIYWVATRLFKKQFMQLMGATPQVIQELTTEQKELINRLIDEMNPASQRYNGARFDNQAKLPGNRIASIHAPTLIIHAKDDTLQRYHNAEYAASMIPDSKLVSYELGGHLLLAVEQIHIKKIVQEHILYKITLEQRAIRGSKLLNTQALGSA